MIRFDVYGKRIGVVRDGARWRAVWLGPEGKHRPAAGIAIPDEVSEADLERFLADLFHESARPERSEVRRLDG